MKNPPLRKQLSQVSRVLNRRIPFSMIPDHGIQDKKQLPHARGQGNLFWLAYSKQPSIKRLDYRIESSGYQGGHVQSSPHRRSTAPHLALSSQSATIPVERSNSHQGADLVAKVPSSGNLASRIVDTTGPTPGTLRRSCSWLRHTGLERMESRRSLSRSLICLLSHRI